jgi:hypothetical protein
MANIFDGNQPSALERAKDLAANPDASPIVVRRITDDYFAMLQDAKDFGMSRHAVKQLIQDLTNALNEGR